MIETVYNNCRRVEIPKTFAKEREIRIRYILASKFTGSIMQYLTEIKMEHFDYHGLVTAYEAIFRDRGENFKIFGIMV